MLRTPPPRGRTGRRWLLVLAVVGALFAVPAAALADPSVTVDDHVTGREALSIDLAGITAPLTVTAVDKRGETAIWSVEEPGESVALDLLAPHDGVVPVNGPLDVTVTMEETVFPTVQVLLDATPPTPAVTASSSGNRVTVNWAGLRANGPLTYRLERTAGGGVWGTVLNGSTAARFVDKGLEPDWYRYRLTAYIPGAAGGSNASQPADAVVKVAAPAGSGEIAPPPEPDTAKPTAPTKGKDKPKAKTEKPRTHPVSATGRVKKAITSERGAAARRLRSTRGVALVPNVVDRQERWSGALVPNPSVADPRAAGARSWSDDFWSVRPVAVPPVGTIAIDASQAAAGSPGTLFSGLLALVGLTVLSSLVRERRPRHTDVGTIPVPDVPR